MANIGASHQHPRTHQDEDRKSYVIARMMLQCESNKHTPREKVSQGHRSMKQKRRQALLSHSCNSSWFNKQHTTDFGTPYSCKMLLNSCDNIVEFADSSLSQSHEATLQKHKPRHLPSIAEGH